MRFEQSWNLDFSVWDLTSSSGEQMETNEKYLYWFRVNLGPNTMTKELRNTDEGCIPRLGSKGQGMTLWALGMGNNLHS